MQAIAKYSEEFMSSTGLKRWVSHDLPYETTTHDPVERGLEVIRIVHEIALKSGLILIYNGYPAADATYGPLPTQTSTIQVEKEQIEDKQKRTLALIEDINNETVLRRPDGTGGLEAWKIVVKTYPELQRAYDKRYAELTQKQ